MHYQIHNSVGNRVFIPIDLLNLSDGIYLVKRKSDFPLIEHYGFAVSGRFLKHFNFLPNQTKVIHKTNEGVSASDYNALDWRVIKKIPEYEIPSAIMRARVSIHSGFDLLRDNCEQFARFVTEGKKQSTQVQTFGVLSGIALVMYFLRD